MVLGNRVFGSTRWIRVAGFTFQVSEFVKIVIVLLVARYLSDLKAGSGTGVEGPGKARRPGRGADAAGDEAAGSWHFADLYADPGLRHFDGRTALEVHC